MFCFIHGYRKSKLFMKMEKEDFKSLILFRLGKFLNADTGLCLIDRFEKMDFFDKFFAYEVIDHEKNYRLNPENTLNAMF